jgi:hypothetical protein
VALLSLLPLLHCTHAGSCVTSEHLYKALVRPGDTSDSIRHRNELLTAVESDVQQQGRVESAPAPC